MNTPIIFNPEIRLTEHFKLGEFTKSITAERLGISNEPGYEQMLALRHLPPHLQGLLLGGLWPSPARAVHPEKSGSGRPHDPFLV